MESRVSICLGAMIVVALGLTVGGGEADEKKPLTIVALGSSTTARRSTVRKVYADRLQEELPKRGIPVKMINSGIGGDTTARARKRFEKDVLAHNPGLVIIQLGINDSAIDVWRDPPAAKSRVPIERYEENLRHFVRTLKERVEANALDLARNGVPKAPFYLTGNAGGQSFSVHAEGERVILQKDGERKEIELTKKDETPEAPPEPLCPQGSFESEAGELDPEAPPGTSPLDGVIGLGDGPKEDDADSEPEEDDDDHHES